LQGQQQQAELAARESAVRARLRLFLGLCFLVYGLQVEREREPLESR
jgi:hypothetical protein